MTEINVITGWQMDELMNAAIAVRMPDYDDHGSPYIAEEDIETIDSAIVAANAEIARLRDALRFITNHKADPGTALETVVKFAAATLEGVAT